jgi:acetyl-CoA carboxylase biotin carboxyl carrier protein
MELLSASPVPPHHVRAHIGDIGVELGWSPGVPAAAAQNGAARPAQHATPTRAEEPGPPDPGHQFICAPTIGSFYRCPEPGAEPFIQLHETVEAGQQLGILEAMKLMNPVLADVSCRIVAILAEDGMSVEHGQPLFAIEPCED